jgi:hypothetical protein
MTTTAGFLQPSVVLLTGDIRPRNLFCKRLTMCLATRLQTVGKFKSQGSGRVSRASIGQIRTGVDGSNKGLLLNGKIVAELVGYLFPD